MAMTLVLLGLVPACLVRFAFGEPLSSVGLGKGSIMAGLVLLALASPFILWISHANATHPEFREVYPLNRSACDCGECFAAHVASLALFYLGWEFHFRGFLQQGLAASFGPATGLWVQVLASSLLHLDRPEAELWASIPAAILWGLQARYTEPSGPASRSTGCWGPRWTTLFASRDVSVGYGLRSRARDSIRREAFSPESCSSVTSGMRGSHRVPVFFHGDDLKEGRRAFEVARAAIRQIAGRNFGQFNHCLEAGTVRLAKWNFAHHARVVEDQHDVERPVFQAAELADFQRIGEKRHKRLLSRLSHASSLRACFDRGLRLGDRLRLDLAALECGRLALIVRQIHITGQLGIDGRRLEPAQGDFLGLHATSQLLQHHIALVGRIGRESRRRDGHVGVGLADNQNGQNQFA